MKGMEVGLQASTPIAIIMAKQMENIFRSEKSMSQFQSI